MLNCYHNEKWEKIRLNLLDIKVENVCFFVNESPIPNPDRKRNMSTPPQPKAIIGLNFNKKFHCSSPTVLTL